MKHFEIKNIFAGAGGKKPKKPKPPTLKPPNLGEYKNLASYSYSEVVDLLSDGPVEGLTNENGSLLNSESYLQGVYLNDVPVEVTNDDYLKAGQTEDLAQGDFKDQNSELIKWTSKIFSKYRTVSKTFPDRVTRSNYGRYARFTDENNNTQGNLKWTTFVSRDGYVPVSDLYISNHGNWHGFSVNLNYGIKPILSWQGQSTTPNPDLIDEVFIPNDQSNEAVNREGDVIDNYHLDDNVSYTPQKNEWLKAALSSDKYIDRTPITNHIYNDVFYDQLLIYNAPSTTIRYSWETSNNQNYIDLPGKNYWGNHFQAEVQKYKFSSSRPPSTVSYGTTEDKNLNEKNVIYYSKNCTTDPQEEQYYIECNFSATRTYYGPNIKIPMLDDTQVGGIFRNKVSQGIDEVVEIMDNGTRFEKAFLKEKLLDIGLDLGSPDQDFGYDLTRDQIIDEMKVWAIQTKSFTDRVYESNVSYYGQSANVVHQTPYFFVSLNENYVIDGYVQSEHEDLFINPKYKNIQTYQPDTEYLQDTIFAYNGKYYQTIQTWTGNVSLTPEDELSAAEPKIQIYNLDEPEVDWRKAFGFKSAAQKPFIANDVELNFIIPNLDDNGKWNGKVRGFNIKFFKDAIQNFSLNTESSGNTWDDDQIYEPFIKISIKNEYFDFYENIQGFGVVTNKTTRSSSIKADKYNYSNVLMEFRGGYEYQNPLNFFKDVYIDHFYEDNLLGPFSTNQPNDIYFYDTITEGVQRITSLNKAGDKSPIATYDANTIPDMDENFLIALEETSKDIRANSKNFSDWDQTRDFNESASPITHIIQNPNVSKCFISLWITQLSDMFDGIESGGEAGQKKPGIVNIRVEVGVVDEFGAQKKYYDRFFQIIALIESPTILDIGSEESLNSVEFYEDVRELNPYNTSNQKIEISAGGIYTPFALPEIARTSSTNTESFEDLKSKRYIKITKLSTETNSSLVKKDVDLLKVTEIIESTCYYPFSSIVGIKTDSRVFSEIPKRTYRCKLKRVLVPKNYRPLDDLSLDKRYYNTREDFEIKKQEDKLIYKGDWDGTLEYAWTDNPAWILYDMLISKRYGLGDQISQSQVNKWDLYKIGRFCDAVDENGYFVGVDDGRGGVEPRFTCNILFSQGINVFDAINSISAIFRGVVFFENSTINFSDDRLKTPIALFNNSNAKDGFFSYSSYRRDEKFNAVEVSYKDKFDRFKSKIEYVEDEEDIKKRGLFKKEIIGVGITSKAMALRAAKHVMYQTTKENETVSFVAGVESLLCKPGDLIIIEDDLKTLNTNFGRVLEINDKNKTIRTSEKFKAGDFNQKITLYIPTGNKDKLELDLIAGKNRRRLKSLEIVGDSVDSDFNDNFSGVYNFFKYSKGYDNIEQIQEQDNEFSLNLYEEYAVYTGENESNPIIWFDTYSTGWVFSTGESFTNDNNYNKFITSGDVFDFQVLTVPNTDQDISGSSGWLYDSALENKRASAEFSFSGQFLYDNPSQLEYTDGILESEINISSNPQIRTFNITGWGGYEGLQAKEYGDIVYIDQSDINADLLKYVPEGTTYRFESKSYSDQVYKIQSIKEEDDYSYNIIANKYDSGKYEEIENSIGAESKDDVFGYDQLSYNVNEIDYINLEAPTLVDQATGLNIDEDLNEQYYINLTWDEVEDATGYRLIINGYPSINQEINTTGFFYENNGTYDIYTVKIKSLANIFDNDDYNTRYNDSDYTIAKIIAGDPNEPLESSTTEQGQIINTPE